MLRVKKKLISMEIVLKTLDMTQIEREEMLGISSLPILELLAIQTVAFFDENANYISPIVGYHNVQQMEFYLKLFSSNDYKKLKSQEDFTNYYKNFTAQFKG